MLDKAVNACYNNRTMAKSHTLSDYLKPSDSFLLWSVLNVSSFSRCQGSSP
jgi:hypothetical protein